MSERASPSPDATTSDKWWLPIGVVVALIPVQVVVPLVLPPDAVAQAWLLPVFALGWLLLLLSPVFLYFDRRYLAEVSEWAPSTLYYLMVVPPIGIVLSVAYVYRRHQAVGVP